MSAITCNGAPVLELLLTLPVAGAWVAEIEADSDDAINGEVTIADEEMTFRGTAVRSGVLAGSCRLEVVGGTNGLAGTVPARSYVGVTARAVLADILAACKERLDPSAQAAVLSRALPYWTRAAVRGSTAVAELVAALDGARWRVLPNGAVWAGRETWPQAAESLQAAEEIGRDDAAGTVLLAPDSLALLPGVTLEGRRVGRVEHRFGRGEALRTTYWVSA